MYRCRNVMSLSQACPARLEQLHQHRVVPHCQHSIPHQQWRGLAAAGRSSRSAAGAAEEDDEGDLPPESKVFLEKKDITIKELADKARSGELDLQPSYQRGLVWDKKMASRLVVTALEKRVVPTVYLEQDEDSRWSVMDGKQRLASLIAFYLGSAKFGGLQWSQAPTVLDINDETSCDPRWDGKTFESLPVKRQRQYKDFSLMCVIVSSDTDRDVVFNIYQDINTGAVGHTAQQSRKAAFHGPYVELLDELAKDEYFLKIQGRTEPDQEKESDRELALRFFAMLRSAERFKAPLGKFLNLEIKTYQHADAKDLEELGRLFKTTTATVWQIWGPSACRSPSSRAKDPFSPALWDAVMVGVCKELEAASNAKQRRKQLTECADAINVAYRELLRGENFRKATSRTSRPSVVSRIALVREMLQRAAPPRQLDSARVFSPRDKLQLWQASTAAGDAAVCGICCQVIHQMSDAEVDHITPWSHGGRTQLSNAQLVHSYCNKYKGNRVAGQQAAANQELAAGTAVEP